ncbi:MAG: tRNA 2-thiouridine(34) synthase MnmA [Candidatus Latescibacteria bacterium]|jgi:tRNA-specific 2-thiouridylase|nr:tRNA 2-thiouridine(34) synthase MnmA [Candidatus Latescibacterota bacterium]
MKTAVLLSGGVDSSVALSLLAHEGRHDLTAFYLRVWLEDELSFLGDCPWEADLESVRAVCDKLGVPLETVSLQSEYLERVVTPSLDELRAGRTPSPDLLCNQRIKFGEFLSRIDASYARVASGHYAQIVEESQTCLLKRSPDAVKDQTYFLSRLNQTQLGRALFPVGHLTKPEVRSLANEFDLPNKDRKDSQGICFLGKISYPDFVRFHLKEQRGDIVEIESGQRLGQHRGFWFYTIGQREGLGLGGGPWYVADKDMEKNTVYVTHGTRREALARNRFTARDLHWISDPPGRTDLQLKIRHGPDLCNCRIGEAGQGRLTVEMDAADSGVAPGQYAVFYDGEICLGSGVIE